MFNFFDRIRAANALTSAAHAKRRFNEDDLKTVGLPAAFADRFTSKRKSR